ncbi:MAG TPA: Gfo/Idh/MocA family oxidoreductase [bacterium]|nr:Gfo/Idh/MocA family oxidoreductase [bacterium]
MSKELTRREFIGIGTAAAAGAFLISCGGGAQREIYVPPLMDQAPEGPELRAGLVGCGGRGTGAAGNFLDAGPNLSIVALADVFQDRVDSTRQRLREEHNEEIPDENIYLGFDGYQRLIDSDVDIVLLATPPYFRPEMFEYAVQAKKHVFMEKPVAVDPGGARSVMATSRKAESMGLQVSTGTQRRHQRNYVATLQQIANGAIGDIVAGNCYWDQSQLWYRTRQSGWSEMEYMIRDWVNWTWLSGDHIVEQHVHNIDVINWFSGLRPVSAVSYGARQRRVTGDQYDMFSTDFIYENGMHIHSMCRQINGTHNNVSEWIVGTKGVSNCRDQIQTHDGETLWEYEYPPDESGESTGQVAVSPYVQEHIDMVTNIRNNTPISEAEDTAVSTMCAIMGRISAYTGREVTWEEMMSSDLQIGPTELVMGPVQGVDRSIPVPGTE